MRLSEQFPAGKPQRLFQPLEFFIARRIGNASGFNQRKIRLGNAHPAGEFIERKAEPTPLLADFGAEWFHEV